MHYIVTHSVPTIPAEEEVDRTPSNQLLEGGLSEKSFEAAKAAAEDVIRKAGATAGELYERVEP